MSDDESSFSDSDRDPLEEPSYPIIHPSFDLPSTESLFPTLPSIHILNNDCLYHILSYLDIVDMMRTALVCKRWYNLCLSKMSCLNRLELTPTFSIFRLNKALSHTRFVSLLLLSNKSLSHLDVSHSSLKIDYISCKAIADLCPNLVELNLSKIKIDRKIASYFARHLPPKLSSLILNGCVSLKEKCLKNILMNCNNLEKLDLSYNQTISGKCIAKHVARNKMRYFNFSECINLNPMTVQFVLSNFYETLEHLDLSYCHREVFAISTTQLSVMENLKIFNARCSDFEFADYSTSKLTELLKLMPNLEFLDLNKNMAVGNNATFFTLLSKMCPKLRSLNLGTCAITCSHSLNALGDLESLDSLNLDYLPEDFNYEDLTKATLINCKNLTNLSLQSCFIDDDNVYILISELKNLKSLDLRSCQLSLDGSFISKCNALDRNSPLIIHLQDTWLKEEDFPDISPCLIIRFSFQTYNDSLLFDFDGYVPVDDYELLDDYDEYDDPYDEYDADFWDGGYAILPTLDVHEIEELQQEQGVAEQDHVHEVNELGQELADLNHQEPGEIYHEQELAHETHYGLELNDELPYEQEHQFDDFDDDIW